MCGICGSYDLLRKRPVEKEVLKRMASSIVYRGPDASGYFVNRHVGFGFRRLSIIDLKSGDQPLYNEDKNLILICNGEIFNYIELKKTLIKKGHLFKSNTDVEVILHLYEEYGMAFLDKLNGQFALALYDTLNEKMILARDPMGICPLYYTIVDNIFIFGSEIKAILEHPSVKREVDVTGLDQILSFPGIVSPRTMFKNIKSLKSGFYILVKNQQVYHEEYWDLNYPEEGEIDYNKPEQYYIEKLSDLLNQSIKYRLQADVPVGLYLSGGLDSSLILAIVNEMQPSEKRHSFSIGFNDREICESEHRKRFLGYLDNRCHANHEITFDWNQILNRLNKAIFHSECPLKETYNTASLALSESVNSHKIKVVLSGEGADELFAGYVGYRFDQFKRDDRNVSNNNYDLKSLLVNQLNNKVWGIDDYFYEKDLYELKELKSTLYSKEMNELFNEFDCYNHEIIDKQKIKNRHFIHQRSYLDTKLRLSDHLISDHGDRVALANSVEARYPFLDKELVGFAREIPPTLKLNKFAEKYILKKIASNLLPEEIINREKFGFIAPGSPYLLKQNIEWINDLLSYDHIKKQGYFNPDTIETIKKNYMQKDFKLNFPFEDDLLIIIITFGIFMKVFEMPTLN